MRRAVATPDIRPLGDQDLPDLFAGLADANLLMAVSGGPDSIALMSLVARWRAGRGPVAAATVDHGLRPASRAEAEAVAEFAASQGLPHAILTWPGRPARVSQDAARRARYRLLVQRARAIGATHLLTAHTQDDQAETILMRLAAGSGVAGLAGMRREVDRDGIRHVRPFLTVAKARLVATCQANGWSFVDDPSNADPTFARARWRTLMPALAMEGLDAPRLATLADRLARADAALDHAAARAYARLLLPEYDGVRRLDGTGLAAEPFEVGLRVLVRLLGQAPPRLERVEACLAALVAARRDGAGLRRTLGGHVLALAPDGILTVRPEPARRRGRLRPVTETAVPPPHSLGIQGERA